MFLTDCIDMGEMNLHTKFDSRQLSLGLSKNLTVNTPLLSVQMMIRSSQKTYSDICTPFPTEKYALQQFQTNCCTTQHFKKINYLYFNVSILAFLCTELGAKKYIDIKDVSMSRIFISQRTILILLILNIQEIYRNTQEVYMKWT